jgi:serine/threonine protein kinase
MERAHSFGDKDRPSFEFEFDAEHRADEDGLHPGMHVTPNIELIEPLGTGGMGTVWLAQHSGLGTRVAVKFMSGVHAQDPALVERFAREAKLAARIKSPHVVQTFDYATTENGIPFIVMELLEGQDLQSYLNKFPRLNLEATSRVLVQVCKALAKAHALEIVHRDIKPDNIFLIENDGEPFVKVLDFGIAKDQSPVPGITVSGTTMGTPSFMSPEQLFAPKDVGPRSDLWSAAVVTYRALTGRLPFEGDSFGAVCVAINGGTFPKPSSLNADIPPELDAWFARALARKPSERFQSAGEMANAYLACLHEAGLLPSWAVPRASDDTLSSFSTDPGNISGGPITLPPRRRARSPIGRALLWILAILALLLGGAVVAASRGVPLPPQVGRLDLSRMLDLMPAAWRPEQLPRLAPETAPAHVLPPESPSAFILTPHVSATAIPDPRREDESGEPVTTAAAPPAPPVTATPAPRPAAPPVAAAPAPRPAAPPLAPRVTPTYLEPTPFEPPAPTPAPIPTATSPSGLDPVGEPAVDPHGI